VLGRLFNNAGEYARKQEFWEGLLLNMQADKKASNSNCLKQYQTFSGIFAQVKNFGVDKT